MKNKNIEVIIERRVGKIVLNRPEVRNAINPEMISELIMTLETLAKDQEISALVVRGKGGNFSAGADLKWLKESGSKTIDANLAESKLISDLMEAFYQFPAPVISVAEGAVFGGALGILGCSDWVFSSSNSSFGFSEVRLGLAPAIIMPYVQQRCKSIKIKQFMLTGQSFSAADALNAGLTDYVLQPVELEEELGKLIQTLSALPLNALREIRRLWRITLSTGPEKSSDICINSLSKLKQSPEAQTLLSDFLNKKR
jgi:methylglutaconyl-CoA hydratase